MLTDVEDVKEVFLHSAFSRELETRTVGWGWGGGAGGSRRRGFRLGRTGEGGKGDMNKQDIYKKQQQTKPHRLALEIRA